MAAYCTEDDVRSAASKWSADVADETTRITAAIVQASAMVDQQCGTWFDNRAQTIKTQPAVPGQKRLFMPAPIITLTSLSENGSALTVATQLVLYKNWVEKLYTAGAFSGQASSCWPLWSPGQLNIIAVGTFGYATVPADVVRVTAHWAALLLGMVQRQYIAGDGAPGAATVLALPDWAKATLKSRFYGMLVPQPFVVS